MYLPAPLDAAIWSEVYSGPHWLFRLILWGLYTAMPWQYVPILHDAHGEPILHRTNV
jgi:hypothetical protein